MVALGELKIRAILVDEVTKPIENLEKGLKKLTIPTKNLKLQTDKLATSTKTLGSSMRRFPAYLLSTMFGAMALNRAFGILNKAIMDAYFNAELMNIQLTMFAAMTPWLEDLNVVFLEMTDIFYGLPEPIQGALGAIIFFGGRGLAIASQLGLAIWGLKEAWSVLSVLKIPAWLVPLGKWGLAALIATGFMWGLIEALRALGIDIPPLFEGLEAGFRALPEIAALAAIRIRDIFTRDIPGFLIWLKNKFLRILSDIRTGNLNIWNRIKIGTGNIWRIMGNMLSRIWTSIKDTARGIWEAIGKTIWQPISDAWSRITGFISSIHKAISGVITRIAEIVIPWWLRFQAGGVVPGPIGRPVPAIVHGGETIIPAGRRRKASIDYHPTFNISATIEKDIDIRDLARRLDDLTRTHLRRMVY